MPYAVKCFSGPDAGVILCKDRNELAKVNADASVGLGLGLPEVMNLAIISAHWLSSDSPVFYGPSITIYRLTEEEYERWQKVSQTG